MAIALAEVANDRGAVALHSVADIAIGEARNTGSDRGNRRRTFRATFLDAGPIVGSASILLEDAGRKVERPVLRILELRLPSGFIERDCRRHLPDGSGQSP